jgi:hypothetical protein
MSKVIAFLVLLVSVSFVSAWATIINIPDDYPRIQWGIDVSSDGDTVLVQPDIYVENVNFDGHNVVLASLFLTTGDTTYIASTVIDGDRDGSVITFESGEDSTTQVVGFTITNGKGGGIYPYFLGGGITCWDNSCPTISRNIISENWGLWHGGGIFYYNSAPTIDHNTICDNFVSEEGGGICCISSNSLISNNAILRNEAYSGGGIYCLEEPSPTIIDNNISTNLATTVGGGIRCGFSSPTISRNRISANLAGWGGGGITCESNCQATINNNRITGNAGIDGGAILCWDASPEITNNIMCQNVAYGWEPYSGYGGGICCRDGSSPIVINTVFWADTAMTEGHEIYVDSTSSLVVTYSDIEGGWPGAGNIDIDPLFRDPENGDFHLQSITNPDCGGPGDSPCIDAGDSSFVDSLISCDWGLGTLRSDMGAYGGGDSAQAGITHHGQDYLPVCFSLSQNYPNPFNSRTVISYQLPTNNCVSLEIYNLLGEKVATLVNSKQHAGRRSVLWDASGCSSGLYLYKLTSGDLTETRRMVVIK